MDISHSLLEQPLRPTQLLAKMQGGMIGRGTVGERSLVGQADHKAVECGKQGHFPHRRKPRVAGKNQVGKKHLVQEGA